MDFVHKTFIILELLHNISAFWNSPIKHSIFWNSYIMNCKIPHITFIQYQYKSGLSNFVRIFYFRGSITFYITWTVIQKTTKITWGYIKTDGIKALRKCWHVFVSLSSWTYTTFRCWKVIGYYTPICSKSYMLSLEFFKAKWRNFELFNASIIIA